MNIPYFFWDLMQILNRISSQEFQFYLHASAFVEIHIFAMFYQNIKMDYGLQAALGFALYRSEVETNRAVTVHSRHGLDLLGSLWS